MKFFAFALLAVMASAEECGEEATCLAKGKPCQNSDMQCCDGTSCLGYNFYKSCKEVPACLDEWYDCSQGMDCCGDLICGSNPKGLKECQKKTILTYPTSPAPTPAPAPTKLVTTTPVEPREYIRGCVSGDPHIRTWDNFRYVSVLVELEAYQDGF